jgi:transcriptional regulator with XRE-family HTH domain
MTISLRLSDEMKTEAPDTSLLGRKIRAARNTVGYSIEDLAVTCGLAGSEITAIEDGLDDDLGRVRRIAAALQLPLSSLIDGQG